MAGQSVLDTALKGVCHVQECGKQHLGVLFARIQQKDIILAVQARK